jgi:hypothetical protein
LWRPSNGNWYLQLSSSGSRPVQQWGQKGDLPVVGDFDNDGKADYAVWRPSVASYYVIRSTGAPPNNRTQVQADLAGQIQISNQPPVTPFIGQR